MIGMNRQLTITAVAGAFGGLLFGYDIGAISGATQGLRAHFALSPAALGFAVAASMIGTIVGSMGAGLVADWMERHRVLLVVGMLYMASALGSALVSTFAQFVSFRVLGGLAIGIISVVAPLYLAEVSPSHLRGRVVGSFQLSLGIGVVIAFVWNYLLSLHGHSDATWRWSVGGGVVPALVCQGFLMQAIPSPRWLALKRKFPEARAALVKLGAANLDAEYASLVAQRNESDGCSAEPLFSRRHVRPIFLAISIAVFNQLTGVNVLLYYILDVVRELGSGRLNGRKDAILISTLSLIVTTIAVGVIDKVGRKPLLLSGAAGMSICLVLLSGFRPMHWPVTSVLLILVCYNAFFAFSQGTVVWVYLSELFPLPVRARGQSLGSTANWLANAAITGMFPTMAGRLGMAVFGIFASFMALQFLVVLLMYPETKHRSLEALAADISR
jgi:sugar porter (SP) family MFS transporter